LSSAEAEALHPRDWDLASWSALPASAREWMQGFVENAEGTSRLSFLPSMKKDSNICGNVSLLTSTGKAVVVVHAYVYDNNVCPRLFKVQRRDYRHGSNCKCVVMCIRMLSSVRTADEAGNYRMFMLCMSSKCKHIVDAKTPRGWIEIFKHDYDDLKSIRRYRQKKTEKKEDKELLDIMMTL